MSKYYLTTAIPYTNAAPHLGHAMDYLLADTLRRYLISKGHDVRLQAGTDEHGTKIAKKAAEAGLDPQAFVDANAAKFQDFIHSLGVEYTDFVRTTDIDHVRRCQEIWQKLKDHIYKATYEAWYCEGCEGFVTQKEYDDNHGVCPDHKTPYVRISEDNYFLRISDFKEQIKTAISSDQLKITPVSRKKEFLNLLTDMPDVSISRPVEQVSWGVPVPDDPSQVMYVWIDALTNYITVLGYPDSDISELWPAHTQVVGKDILRFHAGIWPAILLGLGLPLPHNFLVHGFITVGGEKMSKSIGNVVPPEDILKKHGLPALRYYFLRHVSTTEDADFTWEKYDAAYNELANDLGNLVQRLATLCNKNQISGQQAMQTPAPDFDARMDVYEFNLAFNLLWKQIQGLNQRIDAEKPWALAKSDHQKAVAVLEALIKDLLNINTRLALFLPDTAKAIETVFTNKTIAPPPTPLFPKN